MDEFTGKPFVWKNLVPGRYAKRLMRRDLQTSLPHREGGTPLLQAESAQVQPRSICHTSTPFSDRMMVVLSQPSD